MTRYGMIKKLFDRPLPSSTVDVLTNAVVLDAKWAKPRSTPTPSTERSTQPRWHGGPPSK